MSLVVRRIPLATAKHCVLLWHRHHDPAINHRWSLGAFLGTELLGVAMVGRPVARLLDHNAVVEVNRVATPGVDADPRCRGACSLLYRACAAEAEKRGFSRIITYTLEIESGYSLRAARWHPTGRTSGGTWSRDDRPREERPETEGVKIRWEPRRALVPAAQPRNDLFPGFGGRRG